MCLAASDIVMVFCRDEWKAGGRTHSILSFILLDAFIVFNFLARHYRWHVIIFIRVVVIVVTSPMFFVEVLA